MKIWIITDTHFGHDNMLEYCGRPANFSELILTNLCLTPMDKTDILIHLGDFCIGNDAKWHESFMSVVPARKWLVLGNHDHQSFNWYINRGWDWVGDSFTLKYYGKETHFSHCPKKDTGFDVNIHGHFHNTLHRLLEGKYIVDGEKERNKEDLAVLTPKHKLLAIENTNYLPIRLDSFLPITHPK